MCKFRHINLMVFCIALFSGCRTFKESDKDKIIELNKSNLSLLNGTYINYSLDDSIENSYYDMWYSIFRYYLCDEHPKDYTVKLMVIGKRSIKAKLIFGDKILADRKIRGKIKNGYFYRRPLFAVIPFFPVLGIFMHSRSRIAITPEYLIVDQKFTRVAMALGFGGSEIFNHRKRFQKK